MVSTINLVVLFNTRSILSLLGILLIVTFDWQWNRKWEKEGPKRGGDTESSTVDDDEPAKPRIDDYEAMEGTTSDKGSDNGAEKDSNKSTSHSVSSSLSSSKKFPQTILLSLLGWVLLAFSNLLPRKSSWMRKGIHPTSWQIVSFVLLLFLGFIHSNRIPSSIVQGTFSQNKRLWNMIMIGGMVTEGIVMYWTDTYAPSFATPLGGLCIAVAPILLWQSRLVGDTFDSEGRLNPRPVLYNFGGPLLVFGWMCFWMGMNCCYYYPGKWEAYVCINSGMRMFSSFLAGIIIILVTWSIGYALDELRNLSGEVETSWGMVHASAFGFNDYFCGYVYEIKVASIIAWAPLGLAAFFPHVWGDYTDWLLLMATFVMGYSMAMIQEEGLRMMEVEKIDLWLQRSYGALAAIAILIPLQRGSHYFVFVLSFLGALAFGVGYKQLLSDQKRGKQWIIQQQIQEPTVFSYGVLFAPLGALLLSWAVNMHPK